MPGILQTRYLYYCLTPVSYYCFFGNCLRSHLINNSYLALEQHLLLFNLAHVFITRNIHTYSIIQTMTEQTWTISVWQSYIHTTHVPTIDSTPIHIKQSYQRIFQEIMLFLNKDKFWRYICLSVLSVLQRLKAHTVCHFMFLLVHIYVKTNILFPQI